MDAKDFEIYLEKSKLTMRGKLYNPSAKTVVLCWHGWLDNCLSFDKLAGLLPDLKIYAMDIPGHGLSDHIPSGMQYIYHQFLLWACEWIEITKSEKIILLGHSLGATIFSMVASLFPDKISHIICIDSIGPFSSEKGDLVKNMRSSVDSWFNSTEKVSPIRHDYDSIVALRAKKEKISYQDSELMCKRDIRKEGLELYWNPDKRLRLKSPNYLYEEQIIEFFKANKSKNLILYGEDGFIKKYDKSHRIKYFPNCTAIQLKGGHHLHIDYPELTADTIKDWLINQ